MGCIPRGRRSGAHCGGVGVDERQREQDGDVQGELSGERDEQGVCWSGLRSQEAGGRKRGMTKKGYVGIGDAYVRNGVGKCENRQIWIVRLGQGRELSGILENCMRQAVGEMKKDCCWDADKKRTESRKAGNSRRWDRERRRQR